ncbi:recombinase family protein [Streptomyces sp. NPDC001584]|uniref:recombinase family protein n=1 Tax=Streptomyces sp. NPDC001584 TaxID=3154521 RepID=UPI00332C11F7
MLSGGPRFPTCRSSRPPRNAVLGQTGETGMVRPSVVGEQNHHGASPKVDGRRTGGREMPYRPSPGTRVLKMRRISRDSEDGSALARQAEALDGAVAEGRFDEVGDVEDTFVSGAVSPEERPGLGRWMREPLWYEWDAIMVTSLDRITRNQTHWEMPPPRSRFPP